MEQGCSAHRMDGVEQFQTSACYSEWSTFKSCGLSVSGVFSHCSWLQRLTSWKNKTSDKVDCSIYEAVKIRASEMVQWVEEQAAIPNSQETHFSYMNVYLLLYCKFSVSINSCSTFPAPARHRYIIQNGDTVEQGSGVFYSALRWF